MAQVLLRIVNPEHFDYRISDDRGNVVTAGSAFHPDQYPDFPAGAKTVLIVPGEAVLMFTLQLPRRSRSQLLKALPFALEDQLIDDPTDLYYVPSAQDAMGKLTVAVVKKSLLLDWLEQCEKLQCTPKVIIPDYLAVPLLPQQWHVYLDGERLLLRQDTLLGMSVELEHGAETLSLSLIESSDHLPEKIILDYDDGNEHFELEALGNLPVPVEMAAADTFCMDLFAAGIAQNSGAAATFNLLRGDLNIGKYQAVNNTRRLWKWTAIIFLAWIAVWLVSNVTAYFVLQKRLSVATAQVNALYKQAFPQAQQVVDPQLRVQRALSTQQLNSSGGTFLRMMTIVAEQMKPQGSAITIENVSYHNSLLILSVSATNFQVLANFGTALQQQGLTVQQDNATTQANRVTARLSIKGNS